MRGSRIMLRAALSAPAALALHGCAADSGPLDGAGPLPVLERTAPPRDPAADAPPNLSGDITLRDALAATLSGSPRLAAYSLQARALEAEAVQAGLAPNPELEAELEGFGGTGDLAGFGSSEATLAIGQVVELGGKRLARRRAEQYQAQLAGWDYEVARIDTLAKAAADYIELLGAEQRRLLAEQTAAVSERVLEAVAARVDAGTPPPWAQTRAKVDVPLAQLAAARAARGVEAARVRLASNWASFTPEFDSALGDLEAITEPPPLSDVLARLDQNPDVARWAAEAAARQAELDLAMAQWTPDLAVRAGLRYENASDDIGVVAGLAIPLPLYDRAQGSSAAARLRVVATARMADAARAEAGAAIAEAHVNLHNAHAAAIAYRDGAVPGAAAALDGAEAAFAEGKVGVLELLDAQHTLYSTRVRLVDAQVAYHRARVRIERLLGDPLTDTTLQGDHQ
ncbi:MAG: TolC family protein [Phycisphaerales bacterium JB039]